MLFVLFWLLILILLLYMLFSLCTLPHATLILDNSLKSLEAHLPLLLHIQHKIVTCALYIPLRNTWRYTISNSADGMNFEPD
jgi:hypothetical protein